MGAGVTLECSDCGNTLELRGDDGSYLPRARSFVAAHQLCRPRSVVVHMADVAVPVTVRLVAAG